MLCHVGENVLGLAIPKLVYLSERLIQTGSRKNDLT
jgi:hypothetical protein